MEPACVVTNAVGFYLALITFAILVFYGGFAMGFMHAEDKMKKGTTSKKNSI